jgi:tetratricopeptide (TPR) repeat protein
VIETFVSTLKNRFSANGLAPTLALLLAFSWTAFSYAEQAEIEPQVSSEISVVGDASHLEFSGLNNWKYNLHREKKKDGDVIVLTVPPLKSSSLVRLRTYSDALISSISVNSAGVDDSTELTLHLKSAKVDSFDYLTEQPSKLIVDFFTNQPGPKKADADDEDDSDDEDDDTAVVRNAKPVNKLPSKRIVKQANGTKGRAPASSELIKMSSGDGKGKDAAGSDGIGSEKDFKHGIFDGGDPEFKRFSVEDYEVHENSLIASRADIFIHFPMLQLDAAQLKKILATPPIYEIEPQDTLENKEARLLLTLFNNKRPAIFLKTAKYFQEHYPKSKYDEMVRYMIADTGYNFWINDHSAPDFESAMGQYQTLTEKFPDSPLTARTLLLMGYSYLDRGDNFGAIKIFQRFTRVKPDSKSIDQAKIAIGEAYTNLNRFDDALQILDEVERTATNKKDAIEAAYRRGDVQFSKKDYAQAIVAYKDARKKYPQASGDFPNSYYNLAEAQFWTSEYKDSLNSYRDYLQHFPDHEHGGYAMDRLGELLGIMGADSKRVTGAFLECGFRYRGSPGAAVARVRVLTERMPQMKDKEIASSLKEISTISKETKLPNMDEFVNFMVADTYTKRGEFGKATDELIKFFQQHPNSDNRDKFKDRIALNITEDIRSNVEKQNFIEALRLQSHNAKSWLRNSDRIDTRFYVGRAYEQAGVFKEAASIYRDSLNRLYAIKGTPKEKEISVFETLPKPDALNLRLAVVAAREKELARASDFLKQIPTPGALTEPEQIERAEVSVDVAEARNEPEEAKKYLQELVETWKGQPVAVAGLYLRLAKLQAQTKGYRAAEASLSKIINLQADTGLVAPEIQAKALEVRGDVQLAQGKRNKAIDSYHQLLDAFENKMPLGSVRYKLGKLYYEDGDLKNAQTAWNDLKEDKNDIWYKLAKEQMAGAKWNGEYKRYIDRIPAMASGK